MTFPSRHASRPLGDPVVPPSAPGAACRITTRTGYPRTPHVTKRVGEGVVVCALCGAAWSEGRSLRPAFVQTALAQREWSRLAVERRSAVVDHYQRPFVQWFNPAALIDVALGIWRGRPWLVVGALAVFWLAYLATRLARMA